MECYESVAVVDEHQAPGPSAWISAHALGPSWQHPLVPQDVARDDCPLGVGDSRKRFPEPHIGIFERAQRLRLPPDEQGVGRDSWLS